jgi:hypothetical protein
MGDDTPFNVGDKVQHSGLSAQYEVLGVHDAYLWLQREGAGPYTGLAKVYEKVEPFFEAGKAYGRTVRWQNIPRPERFECTQVERNGSGKPVAFGRWTVPDAGIDRWLTLMEFFDWKKEA